MLRCFADSLCKDSRTSVSKEDRTTPENPLETLQGFRMDSGRHCFIAKTPILARTTTPTLEARRAYGCGPLRQKSKAASSIPASPLYTPYPLFATHEPELQESEFLPHSTERQDILDANQNFSIQHFPEGSKCPNNRGLPGPPNVVPFWVWYGFCWLGLFC